MNVIKEILNDTSHRPYEIPAGNWAYYQEWNRALFLHWIVPYELLRKYVPESLNIDKINGQCYISLVAFTMEKIRPRLLPSIDFISDFDEINVRTYIDNDKKKGVYFLNIEAGKSISAFVAKTISGLPYEKAKINRTDKLYESVNLKKVFNLQAEFNTLTQKIASKTELDRWLTERYCLYLNKENQFYRYDIHHKEWELKNVEIQNLNVNYKIGSINLGEKNPDNVHYSDGIKVLAWKRQQISKTN